MARLNAMASIDVMIRCIAAKQIDLAEAAIRINGLMPYMDEQEQKLLDVFSRFAKDVSHLAVAEARDKISKQERRKQDLERNQISQRYFQEVMETASSWKKYRAVH